MYEDDGKTFNHRKGDWMRIAMSWTDRTRRLTLALTPGSRRRPPQKRPVDVRVAGEKTTRRVVFEGKPIEVRL